VKNQLIAAIFISSALGIGAFGIWNARQSTTAVQPRPSTVKSVATAARVSKLDLRRVPAHLTFKQMDPRDKKRVAVAVIYFCLDKYQRDNCIHHLATCGPDCKKLINPDRMKFITQEYQSLKAQRGL
jgi:hypothetical protein